MFHGGSIYIFKYCREIKVIEIGSQRTHVSLINSEIKGDLGMVGVDSFRKSRRMSDW